MQNTSTINLSQKVKEQLPLFMQEEDPQFVNFLKQYYKSQERTGHPVDLLNNFSKYLDIDFYNQDSLIDSSQLLKSIGREDTTILVEDTTGFVEKDGVIAIDDEVIYYDYTTDSPDVIITSGISKIEFDSKFKELEDISDDFDGAKVQFRLKSLGLPVTPTSENHLLVIIDSVLLEPDVDYVLNNDTITFTTPPAQKDLISNPDYYTAIKYIIGYAGQNISNLDKITIQQGRREYELTENNQPFTCYSEYNLIVSVNGVYVSQISDYTITSDNYIVFTREYLAESEVSIRYIDFIPSFGGSSAEAVSIISESGELQSIKVKNGGSNYSLNFIPRITIATSRITTGRGATAVALISGIKTLNLLSGGNGYTSENPPAVVFDAPESEVGTLPQAQAIVDATTGQIVDVTITNSGSGYTTTPRIKFIPPSGAEVSQPQISNGSIVAGSITVLNGGNGYTTAPRIYVDPSENGFNAVVRGIINNSGELVDVEIINPGSGYSTAPRVKVIQPFGAQILDVNVSNGSVIDIELLTGGGGYIDPPTVYIVDNRRTPDGIPYGGTGATAVATIFNGAITDVSLTNFGSGYSEEEPPTVFIAPPPEARISGEIGFNELTGVDIIEGGNNYSAASFIGCKRGVSGIAKYDNLQNAIFTPETVYSKQPHTEGSSVRNLDGLFLKQIYEKFRKEYLPDINIDYTKVNVPQVIKTIKNFYSSRGTKNALSYLFKILYGTEIEIAYPKLELIKPSAASWSVETVLRARVISGNPDNIKNSQLIQVADEVDTNVQDASALVENVISLKLKDEVLYELSISEETLQGNFIIPYSTRLTEEINSASQIITVDSTIGWPERNGIIRINDEEVVQYKEKSLNQFFECTRGKNGSTARLWASNTTVNSDIYVYANKDTSQEVKLRIVGIAEANSTILTDGGSYYSEGDKLRVANFGSTTEDQKVTSWLFNVKKLLLVDTITPALNAERVATVTTFNPHGLLVGDSVTVYGANPIVYNGAFEVISRINETTFSYRIPQTTTVSPQGTILIAVNLNKGKSQEQSIDGVIKSYTTNVQNVYFDTNYAYVASSGIPNYAIGPFIGSAVIPGNQRFLKRFPLKTETISNRQNINPGPIAQWLNGVSAWTYISDLKYEYGGVTSVSILDNGSDYDAANPPILSFNGGGGSGASGEVVVNGSVTTFEVVNGGSGYTSTPLVSIVGGGGSGATAKAIITNKVVTRVLVENGGTGYTSRPTITISGGGGSGAEAIAEVRGPIQSVRITDSGSQYTSKPSLSLSSGSNAAAQPIVINGRIVSIAVINAGGGYTTAPKVTITGDGYGAIAKAIIGTEGEDRGRVISIQILNKGINYREGTTQVRLESIGQGARFQSNVFEWIYNVQKSIEGKTDDANGYVFGGYNKQYGGEYAHIANPKTLRFSLGDNVTRTTEGEIVEEYDNITAHSPIIGWAYDGNPIYGPYSYTDPTNPQSSLKRMISGYTLKPELIYDLNSNPNPVRIDGPSLTEFPAGTFIQDYKFNFGFGDLDEFNGRFGKTPEYPDGVYAYFITIDASEQGVPIFPYIIGPQYYSVPDAWNFSQASIQANLPLGVSRFRDPYQNVDIDIERTSNDNIYSLALEDGELLLFDNEDLNNDGEITDDEELTPIEMIEESSLEVFDYFPSVDNDVKVDIEVETTTKFESAKISGFIIENPGINYKVNDKLSFDNSGTDGYGLSAKVETVTGKSITNFTSSVVNSTSIATITTEDDHGLSTGDEVIIKSPSILDSQETIPTEQLNSKKFNVKVVSGLEKVTIDQMGQGYIEDLPPTYEITGGEGSGAELQIDLDVITGTSNKITITNSGNGFTSNPDIRISHPQIIKKTNYFTTEFNSSSSTLNVKDVAVAEDRTFYICGDFVEPISGDRVAFLAKYNADGSFIWKRTLVPSLPVATAKNATFNKILIENNAQHNVYVIGEVSTNSDSVYNPDIILVKYKSANNNANVEDGLIQWQKVFAGISGTTRRDYGVTLSAKTTSNFDKIILGGYTDTNSVAGNDIWVILVDTDGDVIKKRKIASSNGTERLTDLIYDSDTNIYLLGINSSNYIILSQLSYDELSISIDWIKTIRSSTGTQTFSNPKFVKSIYGEIYIAANKVIGGNVSTISLFKIQTVSDGSEPVTFEYTKDIVPNSSSNLNLVSITYDVFDRVNVGIRGGTNNEKFYIAQFKQNGTLLSGNLISDNINSRVYAFDTNNSGDVVFAGVSNTTNSLGTIGKIDYTRSKTGTYTLTTLNTVTSFSYSTALFTVTDLSALYSTFDLGSDGLQLLDFNDAVSGFLPGNYSWSSETEIWATRTATAPSPNGKRLLASSRITNKFYFNDIVATKSDNVKLITLNQEAEFTKGTVLQQYTQVGENRIVSSYATILDSFDDKIYIGKIYGNFDTIKPLQTTANDQNKFRFEFTLVEASTPGTFVIDTDDYVSEGIIAAYFPRTTEEVFTIEIVETISGSPFIVGNTTFPGIQNIVASFDSTYKELTLTGLTAVTKINLTVNLNKLIIPESIVRTNKHYVVSDINHDFTPGKILFVEGFTNTEYNGSYTVTDIVNSKEFTYTLPSTPSADPGTNISNVKIYIKHPILRVFRGQSYIFDVSDASNLGYFLSFSKDNQYKLPFSFNNLSRKGTPGINPGGEYPYVLFKVTNDVPQNSYYFDPSHTGDDSPVDENSYVDVKKNPYEGKFVVRSTPSTKIYTIQLPFTPHANPIIETSSYTTTSTRALGPIGSIKLVNAGGFYKTLPIVTDIASERKVEKVNILNAGTEYEPGVYSKVPILGDGEGGKCTITVDLAGDPVTGQIISVVVTDPGKGYKTASIDVDSIDGILGDNLAGSGADLEVVIPPQGTNASVFLTGEEIGRIKKLKNNDFGFDYSHDYTLKPEIKFPVVVQLFNTSILSNIKVSDPGSGYTTAPIVEITGGGGSGAEAIAIVKNNRLQEIVIKNPGSGYSSQPIVALKSEFNYVVNLDLGYLQFNYPHGIENGSEVSLRADDVGSSVGTLPQPSSAGLTQLIEGQTYYAIAGTANSLESDQLRLALTPADAQSGNFIAFSNGGAGRQVLLTDSFGGKAEATVETSRFLSGEKVYQGLSIEQANAVGYVSTLDGWKPGSKLLKITDVVGEFIAGQSVIGVESKASGVIDTINQASGTLNIGSLTTTKGKFIDDVGKPSEIVQKIQDSFFYQDFSYVVKSEIPVSTWRDTVTKVNHPVGFNLFGQLNLTGGKDVSGRKVSTEFIREVNIQEFTSVNEIINFSAAQPIYSDFNNSQVLFRNKRLTNSEEILTSVVKKLDDISEQFDGVKTEFTLTVNQEPIIVNENQLIITLNGIAQTPGSGFTTAGSSIVFSEPPKPAAKVTYAKIEFETIQVKELLLSDVSGAYPEIGMTIRGLSSDATATVVGTALNTIKVINEVGSFDISETIFSSATGFNSQLQSIELLVTAPTYQQGETITNLFKKTAVIEETNINEDAEINNILTISRTSGTQTYETGNFEIELFDIIVSASTGIVSRITSISPYTTTPAPGEDPEVISTLSINDGTKFFGMVYQRLPSPTNQNTIVDDISKTVINITALNNDNLLVNQNFTSSEEVRHVSAIYGDATVGTFNKNDVLRNDKVYFTNVSTASGRQYDSASLISKNKEYIIAQTISALQVQFPAFNFPNDDSTKCARDIGYVIDAIIADLETNGNAAIVEATEAYYGANGAGSLSGELTESIWAFKYARDLCRQAIINQLPTKDYAITPDYIGEYEGITFNGNAEISSTQSKFGSTSLKLDGVGDYLQLTESSKFDFGNYTIESWIYVPSLPTGTYAMIFALTGVNAYWGLRKTGSTLYLTSYDGVTVNEQTSGTTVQLNQWTHVAWSRQGTSIKAFVNGTLVYTGTSSNVPNATGATIGYATTYTNQYQFNGYIDEIHVSNGISRYGSNFSVPTDRSVSDQNTSLLLHFQPKPSYTITVTDILENTFTSPSHGMLANYIVKPTSTSNNLIANQLYYVVSSGLNTDTFKLALTPSGTEIDVTSATGLSLQFTVVSNFSSGACVDVQNNIDTLFEILTSNLSNGNLNNLSNIVISNGLFELGSTLEVNKLVYEPLSGDRFIDASNLILRNKELIAYEAYADYVIANPSFVTPTGDPQDCIDDVLDIIDAIAYNVKNGGNNQAWDAGNIYVTGQYVASQKTATVNILNRARDMAIQAMRNETITINGSHGYAQYKDLTITVDPSSPKCADVASTITNLFAIITVAVTSDSMTHATKTFPILSPNFTAGETLYGRTSGATATIIGSNSSRGYIYLSEITGIFEENEVISNNDVDPFIGSEALAVFNRLYQNSSEIVNIRSKYVVVNPIDIERDEHRIAADFINDNRRFIVEEAVGRMKDKYPLFTIPGDSIGITAGTSICQRDSYYIVDAFINDLRNGGNENSINTARYYVTGNSDTRYIKNELVQSAYTYQQIGELCKELLSGSPVSGKSADAYNLLIANAEFIGHEAVALMRSAYPGWVSPTGNIQDCTDDIIDIVKELAFNVKYGGNNRIWDAANIYVTGQYVGGNEDQTVSAIAYARDLAKDVINNTTIIVSGNNTSGVTQVTDMTIEGSGTPNQCTDIESTIDTLSQILIDAIGVTANPGDLSGVQRIAPRLENEFASVYPLPYLNSNTISNTVLDEIDSLTNIMLDIITPTGNIYRDSADLIYFNLNFITDEVVGYLESTFTKNIGGALIDYLLIPDSNTCKRDLKEYILPAVISDLLTGGNSASIETAKYYLDSLTNIIYVEDELLAMIKALKYARDLSVLAVNNELFTSTYSTRVPYRNTTISTNNATTLCANVQSNVAALFNVMIDGLANGSVQDESGAELVFFNQNYIKQEAYNNTLAQYSTWPGTISTSKPIVDAIVYDLIAGGNAKTYALGLSWINSDYQLIAFQGYNPVHIQFLLDKLKLYMQQAAAQTLASVAPISGIARYIDAGLSINSATTTKISDLVNILKGVITSPSSIISVTRDAGPEFSNPIYPLRDYPVSYSSRWSLGDIVYSADNGATTSVSNIIKSESKIRELYSRFIFETAVVTGAFSVGEEVYVEGLPGITGYVLQTDGTTYIDLYNITGGTINVSDVIVGDNAEATVETIQNRVLLTPIIDKFSNFEVVTGNTPNDKMVLDAYYYNNGGLIDNTQGRLTLDVETVEGSWKISEIVYGSDTEYLLTTFANGPQIENTTASYPSIGEWLLGDKVVNLIIDTNSVQINQETPSASFVTGFTLTVLDDSNLPISPTITATICKYDEENGIISIANITGDIQQVLITGRKVSVYDAGIGLPTIFATVTEIDDTSWEQSYGKIVRIEETGVGIKYWVNRVQGTFLPCQQILAENYRAIVSSVNKVEGRVKRYFRGFDGDQTSFKLTTNNGTPYLPDPDGHVLVFINGILQPPGAFGSYITFSDTIEFNEAPEIGSSFSGYYVGKLRALDDISFEFDSLKSSFNLKLDGVFYSLTVTDSAAVTGQNILPENNIIVSLNGVIQEPGVGFTLVGSRIIFSEIPRSGSSIVAFSYIGSDADVVAARVIPPIEVDDELFIEGEEFARRVALIESSNSLITYEYNGSVRGRNGSASTVITKGRITTATVTAPGSGYTSRPNVEIISPTGFDGQLKPLVGVYRVDVKTAGSGYKYPRIEITSTPPT